MSETENDKKICMHNAEGVGEGEKSSGPWASENKRIKLGENLIDQAAILDSFCSKRSIFLSKEYFPMLMPNLAILKLIVHALKFSAPAQWLQVYAAD